MLQMFRWAQYPFLFYGIYSVFINKCSLPAGLCYSFIKVREKHGQYLHFGSLTELVEQMPGDNYNDYYSWKEYDVVPRIAALEAAIKLCEEKMKQ